MSASNIYFLNFSPKSCTLDVTKKTKDYRVLKLFRLFEVYHEDRSIFLRKITLGSGEYFRFEAYAPLANETGLKRR